MGSVMCSDLPPIVQVPVGFSEGKIEFSLNKVQQSLLDVSPSFPSSFELHSESM